MRLSHKPVQYAIKVRLQHDTRFCADAVYTSNFTGPCSKHPAVDRSRTMLHPPSIPGRQDVRSLLLPRAYHALTTNTKATILRAQTPPKRLGSSRQPGGLMRTSRFHCIGADLAANRRDDFFSSKNLTNSRTLLRRCMRLSSKARCKRRRESLSTVLACHAIDPTTPLDLGCGRQTPPTG